MEQHPSNGVGQNGLSPRLSRLESRQKARRRKKKRKMKIVLGVFAFLLLLPPSALGYMAAFQHWMSGADISNDAVKTAEPTPAPDGKEIPAGTEGRPGLEEEPGRVRLMFVGDTMMDGHVANVMLEKGDAYPLSEFMPVLQRAHLVVANLETAVGTSRRLAEKTFAFQTDPARFALFAPLRDRLLFTLANNHGMDAPLEETMFHMERMGYPYIGVGRNRKEAYRPFVAEINGIKLAILGASRVIPTVAWVADDRRPGMASAYSDEPLLGTVRRWSRQADHVIVFLHWGKERESAPDEIQLELAEKLLAVGARLIIGAHPHVLQEIRWTPEGQLVAFSLGNFVFTTSAFSEANDTAVLDVTLTKEAIAEARIWPGRIHFGLVRRLAADDPEGAGIRHRLDSLSPTIRIDSDGRIRPSH